MKNRLQSNKGFTLLEIIAVLVIAAIAAVVVTSVISRNRSNLKGRTEALKAHIRYAQSMAMSTDKRNWGIRFDPENNDYWLFFCEYANLDTCNPDDNIISIPGTQNPQQKKIDLDSQGLTISISTGSTDLIAFNNFGTPYKDTAEQNLLQEDMEITMTDQAGNSENINITPTTGFVP